MKTFAQSSVITFCKSVTWVGLFLLYIPLIFLVLGSFSLEVGDFFPRVFTIFWYEKLLGNQEVMRSFYTSVVVAFLNTIGSTVLGTATAIGLSYFRASTQAILRILMAAPLLMPEIVLGLSLLVWFSFLRFTLGLWSLTLAHITFSVSYVILMVQAGLESQDKEQIEAARGLGANAWVIFLEITLPQLKFHIASSAIIACTLSFDDFLISFFTAGVGFETIPVHLYSAIRLGVTPEMNALSSLLIVATAFLVTALMFALSKRSQKE